MSEMKGRSGLSRFVYTAMSVHIIVAMIVKEIIYEGSMFHVLAAFRVDFFFTLAHSRVKNNIFIFCLRVIARSSSYQCH
jgi:hypothetical protein